MAFNPSGELQIAITQKLRGEGYNVYDSVPLDAVMPYFTIGSDTFIDSSIKGRRGTDHVFTVDGWSKGKTQQQIKEMQAKAMQVLLETEYTLTGATLLRQELELTQVLKDPSSTTSESVYHLVLQVRYVLMSN